MKKVLLFLLAVLVIVIAIVLVRTYTIKSKQITVAPLPAIKVSDSAVAHLQQAIRFPTVSNDNGARDTNAFTGFHQFLRTAYPLLHQHLELEQVSQLSLLYHWKGTNTAAHPIILMAHQDVVPIEPDSRSLWTSDPFGGELKRDSVWGRGAVDDKGSLIAIMEGVEQLLREGFRPSCDVYLAFGHDEELLGDAGAEQIVALLKARQVHPAFVLDEGGSLVRDAVKTEYPVAVVGIAEKGYVTVQLRLTITGGHSSMPARQTAIDQLAKAVVALNEHQFPAAFDPSIVAFMDYLAPHLPFTERMALSNRWLLTPMIKKIYSAQPKRAALIHTTTAATIFEAGNKENAIPTVATATMNFRTLPGTTDADVVAHIRKVTNDPRIELTVVPHASHPDARANLADPSFTYMQQAIRGVLPNTIVAPYLVVGATDGRYYTQLTPQVYRFVPFTDLKGFHGINERVGVEEYKKAIAFYYYLIRQYR